MKGIVTISAASTRFMSAVLLHRCTMEQLVPWNMGDPTWIPLDMLAECLIARVAIAQFSDTPTSHANRTPTCYSTKHAIAILVDSSPCLPQSSDLCQMSPVPQSEGPSRNFTVAVSGKDPLKNELFSPNIDRIVCAVFPGSGPLPTEKIARGHRLLELYTEESPLFHQVNSALRNDDLAEIRYYAAFIVELRDACDTQGDRVVQPFRELARGVRVSDPSAYVEHLKQGDLLSLRSHRRRPTQVAQKFGNLVFEVRCAPKDFYDEPPFAPASIERFSDFPEEHEVVIPNALLEVLGVSPGRYNTFLNWWDTPAVVVCQLVGLDSRRGLQEWEHLSLQMPEETAAPICAARGGGGRCLPSSTHIFFTQ